MCAHTHKEKASVSVSLFLFFYQDCNLICDLFIFFVIYFKLFIFIINQRYAINHCIVCSVGHVTLKKVISYITSYFSQILTELHRYKIN